ERPGRADLPWLSGAVQLTLNRLSFRHRALKKKSFSFVALLPDGGNAHAIQAQPATHLSRNILSDYPGSLCFPGDPQCQQQPKHSAPPGSVSAAEMTAEERGLYNLTHNPYGMMLLNAKLLEKLPGVWEPEWRAKINSEDPDSIRRVAFERYGFSEATWDNKGVPMQFVVNAQGGWVQNCMLCHGGRVPGSGSSMIGMPNTELDMQTLYEDITRLT